MAGDGKGTGRPPARRAPCAFLSPLPPRFRESTMPDPLTERLDLALRTLSLLGITQGFLELRIRGKDRVFWRSFIPLDQPGEVRAAVAHALERNSHTASSVLFSINGRSARGGCDRDVSTVRAAVVDVDGKGHPLAEQLARLNGLIAHAPPCFRVDSGTPGHQHVYWRFKEPTDPEEARAVVKRLRKWLGTDPTEPPSRMMRLPGSYNWKNGKPMLIEPCFVNDTAAVSLENMHRALDVVGAATVEVRPRGVKETHCSRPTRQPSSQDPMPSPSPTEARILTLASLLDEETRQRILHGKQAGDRFPSRSEADAAVVSKLVQAAATDDEIVFFFDCTPTGIGEKYHEEGLGYLQRTIDFCRKQAAHRSGAADAMHLQIQVVRPQIGGVIVEGCVLDGPLRGSRIFQGVDASSSAWPYLFRSAGAEVAAPGDLDGACKRLPGRIAWVQVGFRNGVPAVLGWVPAEFISTERRR